MIILCFVIKVDNYAVAETTSSSNKSSMKNSLDDFCTTTINNSLNCKHDHSFHSDRVFFIFYFTQHQNAGFGINFQSNLHNSRCFSFNFPVYSSQDMEKDNKSLPMRVFANTISSFPIDTKSSKATTSLMQISQQAIHRHPHHRLTDIQICSNEIIDLTSGATKEMLPVNLIAQSRPYELTKINNNMLGIFDVSSQNLDILHGISKGNEAIKQERRLWLTNRFIWYQVDSIVGIRDNNLEMKKQSLSTMPPIITLTSSDGKKASDNLAGEITADTDGMLNLISNDLDYLLNRTQEVPTVSTSPDSQKQHHNHQQLPTVTPLPPVAFSNQAKAPALLQHDVIMEESEHEVDS